MTALGSLLALEALLALHGLDPTLLEPGEIDVEPSDVRFVEATWAETVIRGRPWVPFRRLATIAKGTRLAVRGEVQSRDAEGCHGKPWFAVWPFGYVCSEHVRSTDEPPATGPTMEVAEGHRLPHSYAVVREDGVPAYTSVETAELGISDRELTKSMTLVVARTVEVAGQRLVQSQDGLLIPKDGVGWMGQGSEWQGVEIDVDETGPFFAWVRKADAPVRAEPRSEAAVVAKAAERQRVPLLDSAGGARPAWWRVGENAWMAAGDLNEVHVVVPPEDVVTEFRRTNTGNEQWFDVDVGEQVLVAYRGDRAVYATLISSGRGSPTPLGNYPVWAKVASMDMSNQDYEDKPYMVQGVPWVLLFQGHNALHGAYWHDRFGNRKSHGCVNLAPADARWIFEWTGPSMPPGWTGYLPGDLHRSAVVHVRDSSREGTEQFTQQRPWGPPDREEEARKLEEAQRRREALAETEAAQTLDDDPLAAPSVLEAPSGFTRFP